MTDPQQTITDSVDRALDLIGEHCDSVHIFVTLHREGGTTVAYNEGRGNWYTRLGQIGEFLTKEDARTRMEAVATLDD